MQKYQRAQQRPKHHQQQQQQQQQQLQSKHPGASDSKLDFHYYDPSVKIRSLIANLDAELEALNQISVPRPIPLKTGDYSTGSSSSSSSSNQRSVSTTTRPMITSDSTQASRPARPVAIYAPMRSPQPSAYMVSAHSPTAAMQLSSAFSEDQGGSTTFAAHTPEGVPVKLLSRMLRARVMDAYRTRKIFTVHGNFYSIRRALLSRGWLEKLEPGRYPRLHTLSEEVLLRSARRGNDYETVAISKIIHRLPAFFVWQARNDMDLYRDFLPYRNRVRRSRTMDFSTKVGLIGCAEGERWFTQENVSGMSYPRFYRLHGGGGGEERDAFVDDFRQTQVRSLLRLLVEMPDEEHVARDLADEELGSVNLSILTFALDRAKDHLNELEHRTIDEVAKAPSTKESENYMWQDWIVQSRLILWNKAKFKARLVQLLDVRALAKDLLTRLERHCPQYRWDGCRNLWILKPGFQSRGIGIVVRNVLEDILQYTGERTNRCYIAQKYIERPLLVYKTKFDIRQYMLLTIGSEFVRIWLYQDCYFRFSGHNYRVDDLRPQIHITNYSIQKYYKNESSRDARLPRCNMWSLAQFKAYLRSINVPESMWQNRTYAGFKENLTAVVSASLDETQLIPNAFELFGCDFMLDEDYRPILIEINATPDLSPSTDVTARICPNVLRDVVKVVVDRSRNLNANTGQFEMIYEVRYKFDGYESAPHDGMCEFDVAGKPAKLHVQRQSAVHNGSNNKQRALARAKRSDSPKRTQPQESVEGVVVARPVRYRRKARRGAQSRVVENSVTASPPKTEPDMDGEEVKNLNSADKQALALQYTAPK